MSGAAQAFIAFLRCEATQSEERAKSLRATAAAIEANNLEGVCASKVRTSCDRLSLESVSRFASIRQNLKLIFSTFIAIFCVHQ